MNATEAKTLLSTFDPALQEAGEAVVAELPLEPDQKMKFGIFALLAAIASILTIINFCRSRNLAMDGLSVKKRIGTLTAYDRYMIRRKIHRAIRKSGDFHGVWDLRKQTSEMYAALVRAGGKAEPGRIEEVVGAAMRQAKAEQETNTGNIGESVG
jgi:hypothetical protein